MPSLQFIQYTPTPDITQAEADAELAGLAEELRGKTWQEAYTLLLPCKNSVERQLRMVSRLTALLASALTTHVPLRNVEIKEPNEHV